MPTISSRDNPKIKNARRVRDGQIKSSIFIEGLRLAEEFLRSDGEIFECFYTANFAENSRGREILEAVAPERIFEVSEQILASVADTKNPQGIILIGAKPTTEKESFEKFSIEKAEFPHVVLLHQINNPNNLGAILRTLEAVGGARVIITKNSADVFAPKCLRAAMGAAFRLRFWTNADFKKALFWARDNDLISICADIKAKNSLWKVDWKKPRLLIFGSEARGLSENEFAQIEESFIIPMENDVESLNLAVSCGVVLFAAKQN